MSFAFGNLPPSKTVMLLAETARNKEEDEAVRLAAVEGLGYIEGPSSSEAAREVLKALLADTEMSIPIRAMSARSIGRLG